MTKFNTSFIRLRNSVVEEMPCYTPKMNFILKYQGTDEPDLEKVCGILDIYHVQILDNSLWPGATLVNLEVSVLSNLQEALNGWHIYPEEEYHLPSPRKTIKKSH